MAKYSGKIRIEGSGTVVSVSVDAGNPSEARKIVQNQYRVKQWVRQPYK